MGAPMMIVDGSLAVEPGPDGPDYTRYCSTHRWAGPTLPQTSVTGCPYCALESDNLVHNRFEALMRRMGQRRTGSRFGRREHDDDATG